MADNKKSSISRRSTCYLLNLKQPDKTARRLKLSFQRTAATVTLLKAERNVDASVGFLDVSETGAGVFTPELLHKGSHVELCITEPSVLKIRGIVAWSIPVTSGIHAGKFNCRAGIQFVLDGEAQAQAVQDFVRKAGQDPIEQYKAAANAAAVAAAAAAVPVVLPPVMEVAPAVLDVMGPPEAAVAVAVAPAAVDPAAPLDAPVVAEAPAAVAEAAPAAPTGTPDSGQQAA